MLPTSVWGLIMKMKILMYAQLKSTIRRAALRRFVYSDPDAYPSWRYSPLTSEEVTLLLLLKRDADSINSSRDKGACTRSRVYLGLERILPRETALLALGGGDCLGSKLRIISFGVFCSFSAKLLPCRRDLKYSASGVPTRSSPALDHLHTPLSLSTIAIVASVASFAAIPFAHIAENGLNVQRLAAPPCQRRFYTS